MKTDNGPRLELNDIVRQIEIDFWRDDCKILLAEKIEKAKETFYLGEKAATIARTSIKALCDSYLTQKGINCKVESSFLKSEIAVSLDDAIYEIKVYHKPFSKDAGPLMDLLQNLREMQIKDCLACKKIAGKKTPATERLGTKRRSRKPVNTNFNQSQFITLQLGYALLHLVDEDKGSPILNEIKLCRSQIYEECGLVLPNVYIVDAMLLEPYEYAILVEGKEIKKGSCKAGSDHSIPLIRIFKKNITKILNQSLVNELVNKVRSSNPDVVDDVFITHRFSSSKLKMILNALLAQGVSIRAMSSILETIADFIDGTDDVDFIVSKIKERL